MKALKDPEQQKLRPHVFKVGFVWEGKLTTQEPKHVFV